jgi:hypothetical protein
MTMNWTEVRQALLTAWLILSGAAAVALAAPFALAAESILALAPTCIWKATYGVECPSCGMTRAFILISQGSFAEAQTLNQLAVPLYGVCIWNVALAASYLATRYGLRPLRAAMARCARRGAIAASAS